MVTLEITSVLSVSSLHATLSKLKCFPHTWNVCEKTISENVSSILLSLCLQTLSSSFSSTSDGSTGLISSESMNMGPLERMNSVGVEMEPQETELQLLQTDLTPAQMGRSSHQWRRRTI